MRNLHQANLTNQRVLLRVDFNVPLKEIGEKKELQVADDTRIKAALPTIKYLLSKKAKLIIVTHLGRPEGHFRAKLVLDPVTLRMQKLLGRIVIKCASLDQEEMRDNLEDLQVGEIVTLPNIRFFKGEEQNDLVFARKLAELADLFVNDAFAVSHRQHASCYGVTKYLPSYPGFLMEKEIKTLDHLITHPKHPFVCILGGAKVSEKILVLENLLSKVDYFLLGGIMANTFLKASGLGLKRSTVAEDRINYAKKILAKAKDKIFLSCDYEWDGGKIADIGPQTLKHFKSVIKNAKTIFWNGNLGVTEKPDFIYGSLELAKAITQTEATTVAAGGDTIGFLAQMNLAQKFSFISTGGGATLEYLAGLNLPGIEALKKQG
jgi:phosphoglycerate kinase